MTTDKFSFERVKMVARFYSPRFGKQILLYMACGVLFGVLSHLKGLNPFILMAYSILSLGFGYMIYWSPLILTGRNRTAELLLPARWSEKAVVLMSYFLVILPLLAEGAYLLTNGLISLALTGHFDFVSNMIDPKIARIMNYDEWYYIPLSYLNIILPIVIFLFTVFRKARPKAWQGILFSIGAQLSLGLIAGIYAIWRVITFIPEIPGKVSGEVEEEIIMEALDFNALMVICTVVISGLVLTFFALSLRALRRCQA